MIFLNKPLLEDYKKMYPHLASAVDRFIVITEKAQWKTPQDIKDSFGRHADYVAPFWIIDVGGKAGIRIILKVQYQEKMIKVERIWINHDEYMRWSRLARKRK
jgi:mRNA-degrading endonuclease HigB of HigAB toxin-antitoxin module